MKIQTIAAFGVGAAFLILAGCQSKPFMAGTPSAVCQVTSLDGGKVSGKVTFTQGPDGVLVEAEFENLTPGKHGIHIHEHGDCGGAAGAAAGGHFNPGKQPHGMAAMAESHEGDLGNLVADANGHARLSLTDKLLSFSGDTGIVGRSIVVHASEDDLASQPAGNSGARIACGLIMAAKP